MNSVLKKLKFSTVVTLGDCPDALNELYSLLQQRFDTQSLDSARLVQSLFAVVHHPEEVKFLSLHLQGKLDEDPLLWIAYPKKSSAKNTGFLSRDQGWEAFAPLDIEPVSQFSIDDDYSVLRFRRVEKIKTITRHASMAISPKTIERLVPKSSKK